MYAALIDLVERFGPDELTQLTCRSDPDAIGPDEPTANKAIGDASAEINAYVGAAYTLPLPNTPDLLRRTCCDIARYRLWGDRASDEVRRRYEDTVKLLDRIAKGTVSLGFSEPAPVSSAGPAFVTPGRVMTQKLDY